MKPFRVRPAPRARPADAGAVPPRQRSPRSCRRRGGSTLRTARFTDRIPTKISWLTSGARRTRPVDLVIPRSARPAVPSPVPAQAPGHRRGEAPRDLDGQVARRGDPLPGRRWEPLDESIGLVSPIPLACSASLSARGVTGGLAPGAADGELDKMSGPRANVGGQVSRNRERASIGCLDHVPDLEPRGNRRLPPWISVSQRAPLRARHADGDREQDRCQQEVHGDPRQEENPHPHRLAVEGAFHGLVDPPVREAALSTRPPLRRLRRASSRSRPAGSSSASSGACRGPIRCAAGSDRRRTPER